MECPRVGLDRFQRTRRVGDDMGTAPAKAIRANSTLLQTGVQARAGGENDTTSAGGADDGAACTDSYRGLAPWTVLRQEIAERAEAARTQRQQFLVAWTSSLYTGTMWISRRESRYKMAQWPGCPGARCERSLRYLGRWESSMRPRRWPPPSARSKRCRLTTPSARMPAGEA